MAMENELKEKIVSEYMEYVLSHEKKPVSVYKFCKSLKITEKDFYAVFASFDALERHIWKALIDKSVHVLRQDERYDELSSSEKLLSFYYTLFENFALNRSYILFSIDYPKNGMLSILKHLRRPVLHYLETLDLMPNLPLVNKIPSDILEKGPREIIWIQFVSIFKFWINDDSPDFEKTDAFIEKSVKFASDLSSALPFESMLDYGKFLFTEGKGKI